MSGSLQLENPCPNCGKNIKLSLKFCNYCGINLEEYDIYCPNCGKSIKMGRKFCNYCGINLVQQKIDKIEITESLKGARYIPICMCLIPTLAIIIWSAIIGSVQGVMMFSLVGAIFLGFYILLELTWIGKLAKPRTFFMSDELIKFSVPKKPLFQIRWNEFVKLEISERKMGTWYTATIFSPPKLFKNLVFYTADGKYHLYPLQWKWDFKKKTCIRIISLLQQYCTKFNKQYVYTK